MTLNLKLITRLHFFMHNFIVGAEMNTKVDNVDHKFQIMRNSEGLRYVIYKNLVLVEQDSHKESVFGTLAKKGHKITWSKPALLKLVDDKIYCNGEKVNQNVI